LYLAPREERVSDRRRALAARLPGLARDLGERLEVGDRLLDPVLTELRLRRGDELHRVRDLGRVLDGLDPSFDVACLRHCLRAHFAVGSCFGPDGAAGGGGDCATTGGGAAAAAGGGAFFSAERGSGVRPSFQCLMKSTRTSRRFFLVVSVRSLVFRMS